MADAALLRRRMTPRAKAGWITLHAVIVIGAISACADHEWKTCLRSSS